MTDPTYDDVMISPCETDLTIVFIRTINFKGSQYFLCQRSDNWLMLYEKIHNDVFKLIPQEIFKQIDCRVTDVLI